MKVKIELGNGELGLEVISPTHTEVTLQNKYPSGTSAVTLTRWDLYVLEAILGSLRNKQEMEPRG